MNNYLDKNIKQSDQQKINRNMTNLLLTSIIIIIVSSINLGLVGFFNVDLISSINKITINVDCFNRIFYAITGLAALYIMYIFYLARK